MTNKDKKISKLFFYSATNKESYNNHKLSQDSLIKKISKLDPSISIEQSISQQNFTINIPKFGSDNKPNPNYYNQCDQVTKILQKEKMAFEIFNKELKNFEILLWENFYERKGRRSFINQILGPALNQKFLPNTSSIDSALSYQKFTLLKNFGSQNFLFVALPILFSIFLILEARLTENILSPQTVPKPNSSTKASIIFFYSVLVSIKGPYFLKTLFEEKNIGFRYLQFYHRNFLRVQGIKNTSYIKNSFFWDILLILFACSISAVLFWVWNWLCFEKGNLGWKQYAEEIIFFFLYNIAFVPQCKKLFYKNRLYFISYNKPYY